MTQSEASLTAGAMVWHKLAARIDLLLLLCGAFVALALLIEHRITSLALLLSGFTLCLLVLLVRARPRRGAARSAAGDSDLHALLAGDPTPALISGPEGHLTFRNPSALEMTGHEDCETVVAALASRFNNADSLVRRLLRRAQSEGALREDVVSGAGHVRLIVQSLDGGNVLWRIEQFAVAQTGDEVEAQVPLISVGRGQAILYMNAAARKLVGGRPRRLEDLLTRPLSDLDDLADIKTSAGTTTCRMTQIANSGGRREFLFIPVQGEIEIARPRVDTRPEESIWTTIDDLPVPMLRLSVSGTIELANGAAQQLLSIDREPQIPLSGLMEGLGRSINEWLVEAATAAMEHGAKPHSEFLRLSRSEREVFVQVAIKPVRHEGQIALIAMLSDATELKTLEAQFVQSQKMQAIGQLAGGVAHDFNNLLTAISGHCDLLLLRHDHGDPDYGDLIQINQNANRAASLVGQLLAFSRKQTLRPETLDLRNTLSDLTHLLNRLVGEKVTLALRHDPALPKIRADKRQLEQVLMNLVVNARDAMPNGGEIQIETETLHLAEEMLRDRASLVPGEYVIVTVTDTGVGIPPDKLPKVFEPFFTTKRVGEGTGLGLSTAYGIVKQSGGFIFVDSTPGEGTCFTLMFPAQREEDVVMALPAPVVEPDTSGRADGVVLLVEDEAPVRAFASRALRLRGYTVLEADSAEQALEMLDSCEMKIDVFVTDVIMPGMDGPTWVRKARETYPDVRVVFVSGYAEDSFRDSNAKIANSVFLPKPFSLAELTETVRKQIR
ncbi:hybrid sensor histidine kinase/response regulator [Pseudooceanicola spongiae]|nr:ATP-binding protein [Pseudooceanicola spongiae]